MMGKETSGRTWKLDLLDDNGNIVPDSRDTISVPIEAAEYKALCEFCYELAVTPEYLLQLFVKRVAESGTELIRRYESGESPEDLIADLSRNILREVMDQTARYRKIAESMKYVEKEMTEVEYNARKNGQIDEDTGVVTICRKSDGHSFVVTSLETMLAATAMTKEEHFIRMRSELLDQELNGWKYNSPKRERATFYWRAADGTYRYSLDRLGRRSISENRI